MTGTFSRTACVLVIADARAVTLPREETLQRVYELTPRQAQVSRLLARGWSNRRIARHLGISPHTARHHAQAVLECIGVHSRKALGMQMLTDLRRHSPDPRQPG